jgi:transitional endoplasmic reticulum ATPase
MLSNDLKTILCRHYTEANHLLANFYQPATPGPLKLSDYDYLQQALTVLVQYLRSVLSTREKGVNILFYGRPGMGKTALAKALAQALEVDLFEVHYADEEGGALSGQARMTGACISQKMLSHHRKPCLLMLDEAEDVFPGSPSLKTRHVVSFKPY